MATHTLSILKPSVNNLTVRIFVRAAGLDFEEKDVWGHTTEPEYLGKYPPHLTPSLECEGLPRSTLGEVTVAARSAALGGALAISRAGGPGPGAVFGRVADAGGGLG